jgi:hypothetical protein
MVLARAEDSSWSAVLGYEAESPFQPFSMLVFELIKGGVEFEPKCQVLETKMRQSWKKSAFVSLTYHNIIMQQHPRFSLPATRLTFGDCMYGQPSRCLVMASQSTAGSHADVTSTFLADNVIGR